ncbi:hypothetical protein CsSME_00031591 [Camellia sinensis var. sinensis]
MVDSLDDLVGRVVAAAGVVKVELSPVKEPLGSDLPKVLVINSPELPKELREVEVPAVVKIDGALESKSVLEIGSLCWLCWIIPCELPLENPLSPPNGSGSPTLPTPLESGRG